jgi:dihydroxyacid dehydratase/phosphogluconate dehydratase
MLNGRWRGQTVGSGTSVWQLAEQHRAGQLTDEDLADAESCMSRSRGHCMTMGTASTMALLTEVLGMQLPKSAELPADDARRRTSAHLAGRRIVAMVAEDLRPSRILTREAFENAVRVNAAIGGSTNAVVHLLVLARRVGVDLELDDFDVLGREIPTLVDLMPSGRFLMEDFTYAGGLAAVIDQLGNLLHRGTVGVGGITLAQAYADAPRWNEEVVRGLADPLQPPGSGTAVLRGNLAPRGAVLKQSAASPKLMVHRGRARVWDDYETYLRDADDPNLDVEPGDVLVLRGAGPKGYPGMPEIANLPLPVRILAAGVTDMVRISDARMSGTAYGTVVLHVCPESAVGGPLAAVRDGDIIELNVPARRLHLDVADEEIARRLAATPSAAWPARRGYQRLYVEHVLQADEGADFDFLVGSEPAIVPRRSQ